MAVERQPIHPQHVINTLISGQAGRGEHKVVTQHIQRYLALPAGSGPAIDLMCGTGYGCAILHAKGYDPIGVDRDVVSVRNASVTYCGCHFHYSDVMTWTPPEHARIGVCFEGLEHIESAETIVPRMAKWADEWYVSIPLDSPNQYHLRVFSSRQEIRELLLTGFETAEWRMPPGYWRCSGATVSREAPCKPSSA